MIYLIIGIVLIIYSYWRPLNTTELFLDLRSCCSYYIDFASLRDGTIVGTDSPAYYSNYVSPYWETNRGIDFEFLFSQNLKANYNVFLLFFKWYLDIFNVQIYQ
jgi:hypothetical protein